MPKIVNDNKFGFFNGVRVFFILRENRIIKNVAFILKKNGTSWQNYTVNRLLQFEINKYIEY